MPINGTVVALADTTTPPGHSGRANKLASMINNLFVDRGTLYLPHPFDGFKLVDVHIRASKPENR